MQTAEEMRAHVTSKAVEDPAFRAQLLADPKGVLGEEFGITVPDSIEIKVQESDLNTIYLALPPSSDLSEEQLEAVVAAVDRVRRFNQRRVQCKLQKNGMRTRSCRHVTSKAGRGIFFIPDWLAISGHILLADPKGVLGEEFGITGSRRR